MKLKTSLLTRSILCLAFLSAILFVPTKTLANTLYPHTKEFLITSEESRTEKITFVNDSIKTLYIKPTVYSFNPETLELLEEEDENLFVKTEAKIFPVRKEEILEIEYRVEPFRNMAPGTYFNLIVLQRESEGTYITETNPVGAVESLSHLVVLHITDPSNTAIKGISSRFATIDLEIVRKGIPLIRPGIVRYKYMNETNYVLNPMGEIQIYSKQGSYAPEYLKINEERKKLYPGGIMEEEIEINTHFSDLYSKRVLVGRFYNGIDENLVIQELLIEPNFEFLATIGFSITFLLTVIKILLKKKRIIKNKKKKPKKNPE